jgi:hypothetical protein
LQKATKFGKISTQKKERARRTVTQRTSPWEAAASPKYISYALLSPKQKRKIPAKEVKNVDRKVDKIKEHNKKEKEKVHVSAGEWRMIKLAINHGTEVPKGSRREVLMGYQYALYQHKKKLWEERDMVFQDNNSISREEY